MGLEAISLFVCSYLCVISGRLAQQERVSSQSGNVALVVSPDTPRPSKSIPGPLNCTAPPPKKNRTKRQLCHRKNYFIDVNKYDFKLPERLKIAYRRVNIGACSGGCPYADCAPRGGCRLELYGDDAMEYHHLFVLSTERSNIKKMCVPTKFEAIKLPIEDKSESKGYKMMLFPIIVTQCDCRSSLRQLYDGDGDDESDQGGE